MARASKAAKTAGKPAARPAKAICSQRQLAKALGVSAQTVGEYLGREDWPVAGAPPWSLEDLEKVNAWRGGLQDNRARLKAKKPTGIDYQLKRQRMLKLKQEREIQAGLYVRKEILERALVAIAEMFVTALVEMEQALPPLVAGRDPGQVEGVLADRFAASRMRLAEKRDLELARAMESARAEAKTKARGRSKAIKR